jgi:hypothetical protein
VNNTATVNVNAHQVSAGEWFSNVGQTGPFDGPAPAGHLNISASATGQLFDPDLSSTTGDIWAAGLDPAALAAAGLDPASRAAIASLLAQGHAVLGSGRMSTSTHLHPAVSAGGGRAPAATAAAVFTGPVTLNPGQSTTITVTITPSGAHGTVVRGHLYIDTWNFFTDSGDEVIDLPYTYKVG